MVVYNHIPGQRRVRLLYGLNMSASVLQQINPSTIKTLYNASVNKVQVTRCINAARITAVVSGVTECDCPVPPAGCGWPWPSDPNLTYDDFRFFYRSGDVCYFRDWLSSAHWELQVSYNLSDRKWTIVHLKFDIRWAFRHLTPDTPPLNNDWDISDCCTSPPGVYCVVGYGGTINISLD